MMVDPALKPARIGTEPGSERVGFSFLLGIYGIEPTDETIELLRESGACGILLSRRNIEDPDQVTDLVRNLEAAVGHPLLVAVEHEGGVGFHFARGMTPFPSAMAVGKAGSGALAQELGQWMARQLVAMHININLAPALDLGGKSYHPMIGTRSFGNAPQTVAEMGSSFIRGLQETGVLAAAKRFPGLGEATGNPLNEPVKVASTKEQIEKGNLVPFREAIKAGVSIIQTAHALYPALEPDPTAPATFSEKIVAVLLRETLGFKGVIMTDDLSSPGLSSLGNVSEAAVRSAAAGHDILTVAHDIRAQRNAVRTYARACQEGRISPIRVTESRRRILSLFTALQNRPKLGAYNASEPEALSEHIAYAAVRVARDPGQLIPLSSKSKTAVIVPRLRDYLTRVAIEEDIRETGAFAKAWANESGCKAEILEVPLNPPIGEVDSIAGWAKAFEVTIVFSMDAHEISGQKRLLSTLSGRKNLIVVCLAHPWDEDLAPKSASVIHTYGFRSPQILAALDLLFHGR